MKILFNATTNVVGGGVKNSSIFIKFIIDQGLASRWIFAVSQQVYDTVKSLCPHLPKSCFHILPSPAHCIESRHSLIRLVNEKQIDIVYTMAGPAYVRFSITHLMGISNPFLTHASIIDVLRAYGFLDSLWIFFLTSYQAFWSLQADKFIFQTRQSRDGFCRRFGVRLTSCSVIPNAFDDSLLSQITVSSTSSRQDTTHILVPGAPYVHKMYQILPRVALEMTRNGFTSFKFILTLSHSSSIYKRTISEAKRLGVSGFISSIGSYSYGEISSIYNSVDLVFVPSVIETFSALYFEALCFNKLLVCADRQHARDVCGDSAIYVNPFDTMHVAQTLTNLSTRPVLPISSTMSYLRNHHASQTVRCLAILRLLESLPKKVCA